MTIYNNMVEGVTRMGETIESVEPWAQAEKNLGLTKSIFIVQANGNMTQYYDFDEGEKFHKFVKFCLRLDSFNLICEGYRKAIKENDKVAQFECLVIFNELDEHPELMDFETQKKLLRIREATHEEVYKL